MNNPALTSAPSGRNRSTTEQPSPAAGAQTLAEQALSIISATLKMRQDSGHFWVGDTCDLLLSLPGVDCTLTAQILEHQGACANRVIFEDGSAVAIGEHYVTGAIWTVGLQALAMWQEGLDV